MGIERPRVAAMAVVGFLTAANGLAASEGSDAYQDGWGPAVGETVGAIAAEDQDGDVRDLASLSGERGLVLVVSRSAVW